MMRNMLIETRVISPRKFAPAVARDGGDEYFAHFVAELQVDHGDRGRIGIDHENGQPVLQYGEITGMRFDLCVTALNNEIDRHSGCRRAVRGVEHPSETGSESIWPVLP